MEEKEYQVLTNFEGIECEENEAMKAMDIVGGGARRQTISLNTIKMSFGEFAMRFHLNVSVEEAISRKIETWMGLVGPCHQKIAFVLK